MDKFNFILKKEKAKEKGMALVLSLVVIIVLTILGTALLLRSVTASKNTEIFLNSTRAFWLAEAGVQRVLWELNSGYWSGWTTSGNNASLQTNWGTSGDYDVTVFDYAGSNPRVEVTGYFPSRTAAQPILRRVSAVLGKSGTVFNYAAFGGTSIKLKGKGTTDSYDSSQGPYGDPNVGSEGDVGTNGDVGISGGNAYVDGDASTGPDGTFDDETKVSGDITHENNEVMPPVSVPSYLSSLGTSGGINSTVTIPSGNYKYSSVNLSSTDVVTIVGPAEIYLTGSTSITVTGQAEVVVDAASTGPVTIYFDGDVNLAGQGITNETQTPSELILYGTSGNSQDINITGQTDFYGAFYAPDAEMKLSGDGALYGSFIGDEVEVSGQGGVHYDEQLSQTSSAVSLFSVESWQDNQNPFSVYP